MNVDLSPDPCNLPEGQVLVRFKSRVGIARMATVQTGSTIEARQAIEKLMPGSEIESAQLIGYDGPNAEDLTLES